MKTKVSNLEKKIPDGTTLIHVNRYNTDKQNLDKKNGDVDKNIWTRSDLVNTSVLSTKISEVEHKILSVSG